MTKKREELRSSITNKICGKCKISLDISAFNKSKSHKDGLQAYCKECTNANKKEWRKKNPGHDKAYRSIPTVRIAGNLRSRVRMAIISSNGIKDKSTMELVGCSVVFLRDHLEHQFDDKMNWTNYKLSGWHVDHIVPCDYFDLANPIHQKRCFHWSNLQPMWGKENMSKSNKMSAKAYEILAQLEYMFPDEPEFDSDDEEDYEEFRSVIPKHEICTEFCDDSCDSDSEEL